MKRWGSEVEKTTYIGGLCSCFINGPCEWKLKDMLQQQTEYCTVKGHVYVENTILYFLVKS